MEEYQLVEKMYAKQQRNQRQGLFVVVGLLALASLIVALDLIRVEPFLIYLMALGLSLATIKLTRLKSRNYEYIVAFLKLKHQGLIDNKPRLFFIDQQLRQSFCEEAEAIRRFIKTKKSQRSEQQYRHLEDIVLLMSSQYDFVMSQGKVQETQNQRRTNYGELVSEKN